MAGVAGAGVACDDDDERMVRFDSATGCAGRGRSEALVETQCFSEQQEY